MIIAYLNTLWENPREKFLVAPLEVDDLPPTHLPYLFLIPSLLLPPPLLNFFPLPLIIFLCSLFFDVEATVVKRCHSHEKVFVFWSMYTRKMSGCVRFGFIWCGTMAWWISSRKMKVWRNGFLPGRCGVVVLLLNLCKINNSQELFKSLLLFVLNLGCFICI